MYEPSQPNRIILFTLKLLNILFNYSNKIRQYVKYTSNYERFNYLGDHVKLDDDIFINRPENISIREGTYIGADCRLNAGEDISIGKQCGIASGCSLISWNHTIEDKHSRYGSTGKEGTPIRIGDGVWLGYDVIVLPGVTIGDGAVVGSGSVVTDDIEPYMIAAGVPAKAIGKRTESGVTYFD